MFVLKFVTSVSGGHYDYSPRTPKNLATPFVWTEIRSHQTTTEYFHLFTVQQIYQRAVVTCVANRMRWLCSFRQWVESTRYLFPWRVIKMSLFRELHLQVQSWGPPSWPPETYLSCGKSKPRVMVHEVIPNKLLFRINPYPTAFPYGNGMVLHFYQQQESSTTKTVHKVINKRLKTYV